MGFRSFFVFYIILGLFLIPALLYYLFAPIGGGEPSPFTIIAILSVFSFLFFFMAVRFYKARTLEKNNRKTTLLRLFFIAFPTVLVTVFLSWVIVDQEARLRKTKDYSRGPQERADISDKKACESVGGVWSAGSSESGLRCITPFADAGKKCTHSEQCQGLCVTNVISQLGKEGTCQKDNDDQGCFNAVENERFDCLLDDIMISCDSQSWSDWCDTLKGDLFFE